ncbi:hypothetical protein K8I61_00550 [bacterium]|nr:hypothetical protein [bacterium]
MPAKVDGDRVVFSGDGYPDGSFKAVIKGFDPELEPGEAIDWSVDFRMKGHGFRDAMSDVSEILVAFAAIRMNDENGRYRDPDNLNYSTFLTPGGMPIETFQYLIPNSQVGGPYRTPFDEVIRVPLDDVTYSDDRLSFSANLKAMLADDFPPGLYRFEIAFFAAIKGIWMKLPMMRGVDGEIVGCDVDYEYLYYSRLFMPPARVGAIAQPRIVWTLLTSSPNFGMSGVVAKEDRPYFAISNRVKPQAKYTLPCTPDRDECVFRLEPELPTVAPNRTALFRGKLYPSSLFEPDWNAGEVSVVVTKPDGTKDDLGTHGFVAPGLYGPKTFGRALDYAFDEFGRYEIVMAGHMFDRFGNRFEAGGTYEVWVAYPLTFSTGMKPGTPSAAGGFYSPAASINPPVPADVRATVRFYPATHPGDELVARYAGQAQKFGYYYPRTDEQLLRFPEAGEYVFEIFATWTDETGRLYMGSQKNASVVLPAEPNLTVKGYPDGYGELRKEVSQALDGKRSENLGNLFFPENSGDQMFFPGNAPLPQALQAVLMVDEPSGAIASAIEKNAPWPLVRLGAEERAATAFVHNQINFPGNQEPFRIFARKGKDGGFLPLLSFAERNLNPATHPDRVRQRGYFYIATSRPGFPVFYVVADSTIAENYWNTGVGSYLRTIGASTRGDQPGDVYWSVAGALYADEESGEAFAGQYGTGAVVQPRGDDTNFTEPPFVRPVTTFKGRELDLYAGMGPSPGTMYETGAVKGIGTMTVPMVAHDVHVTIVAPDGTRRQCDGRANDLGLYVCPGGPLVFDQAGVYRVRSEFREGAFTGTTVGAPGGWFQVYSVDANTRYRVLFHADTPREVRYGETLTIAGRVDPPMRDAVAYYTVVTPGILMDEGQQTMDGDEFRLRFFPHQFGDEFPNVKSHPAHPLDSPRSLAEAFRRGIAGLFGGYAEPGLSDTIEIGVFIEGVGPDGEKATAGGKMALRGGRVLIPAAFRDDSAGPGRG